MIEFLIFILLVTAMIIYLLLITAKRKFEFILVTLLGIILMALFSKITKSTTPQPIDVYRGKTKLIVDQRIRDGKVIRTDSIVVWK